METAILKIVKDKPPPEILAQPALAAVVPGPINSAIPGAVPLRRGRHLDVDDVLARSLRKVG